MQTMPTPALKRWIFVAVFLHSSGVDTAENRAYVYKSYIETMNYFAELKRECPDIIETWIAQEKFPHILPQSNKRWGTCEGRPCQTLIVRIANKKTLDVYTPEVFFSGALHGDERVGPLVVTELAGFLCRQYKSGVEDVKRLVDTRATWLMPMTNADGYANRHREENGMDPNRDFPYLQRPDKCMMTQTARAVNELFRRHLFQFMITFHGGVRSLTYEWGSRNHMTGRKSTEAPDNAAFVSVGGSIRAASGKERQGSWWYRDYGRITDLVYYVDGGMEDWSYGASWEASPTPITVCSPKTYGGYAPAQTKYRKDSIGTLVYLAEMDNMKTPRASTLGRTTEVFGIGSGDGHVARNMRMCLKTIELARPEIIVSSFSVPSEVTPGIHASVSFFGFGCLTFSSIRLLLIPAARVDDCKHLRCPKASQDTCETNWRSKMLEVSHEVASLQMPTSCHGLSIWQAPPAKGRGLVELEGTVPALKGKFCAVLSAEFDQNWQKQKSPDPHVSPRSIAARSRLEDHYTARASDGNMKLDEYKVKLFPVLEVAVSITLSTGRTETKSSTASPSSEQEPRSTASPGSRAPSGSTAPPRAFGFNAHPNLRGEAENIGGNSTIGASTQPIPVSSILVQAFAAVSCVGVCWLVLDRRRKRQAVSATVAGTGTSASAVGRPSPLE